MFEFILAIACAIFVGLTAYSAIWMALLMNKKFIKNYMKVIMDVTNEAMATEVKERTEQEVERLRWTENF